MAVEKSTSNHRTRIASHVPGRIRLKLHPQSRDRGTMDEIKRKLEALEGVDEVRLTPACGSVTVHYDHSRHSMSGILGFLEDLDVVVESIGHLPSVGGEGDASGESSPSPSFLEAVEDLNRRLRKATGLPINLKLILPLTFVGAGIWSIGRRGLMIESVPGGLFLWIAFDMFVKLHPVIRRQP